MSLDYGRGDFHDKNVIITYPSRCPQTPNLLQKMCIILLLHPEIYPENCRERILNELYY